MKVTHEKEVAGLRERMRKEKNAASSTASDQVSRLAGRPGARAELAICYILLLLPSSHSSIILFLLLFPLSLAACPARA